ncbi:MAG TPA: hypothetical protein VMJ65_10745 [Solirubrobacteraceae bacterium]|nr:hypothetical protein [Solirubrobacteraceae bacterium]
MKGYPIGCEIDVRCAVDQAVSLEPREQLAGGDGVEVGRAFQHARELVTVQSGDQLERTGYVERRPNPRDRRSQLVYLTERGRSLPPVTHAAAERVEQRWAQLTSKKELETLRDGLIGLLTELRKP